jgi:hypothetical protein
MPITRALLHLTKIDEFAEWATARGWERLPPRGHYEVLRLRYDQPGERPIIFYRREGSDHATIGWDQGKGHALVKLWLQERRDALP